MIDRTEKIKALIGVAEAYGFSFTDLSIEVYLEALSDLNLEALQRILSYGVKANLWKSFPKPGEILAVITQSADQKTAIQAKKEFDDILWICSRHGRGTKMNLSEAASNALRQIGGIDRIADADDQSLVWARKEFEDCFKLNTNKILIEGRQNALVTAGTENHSKEIE